MPKSISLSQPDDVQLAAVLARLNDTLLTQQAAHQRELRAIERRFAQRQRWTWALFGLLLLLGTWLALIDRGSVQAQSLTPGMTSSVDPLATNAHEYDSSPVTPPLASAVGQPVYATPYASGYERRYDGRYDDQRVGNARQRSMTERLAISLAEVEQIERNRLASEEQQRKREFDALMVKLRNELLAAPQIDPELARLVLMHQMQSSLDHIPTLSADLRQINIKMSTLPLMSEQMERMNWRVGRIAQDIDRSMGRAGRMMDWWIPYAGYTGY